MKFPPRAAASGGEWMRLLVALLAGASMPLAFAPFGWFMVALFAPAILISLWQSASPHPAFWQGFVFGVGMFGFGVYWIHISIHVYGHSSLPLAMGTMVLFVLFLATFPALLGWLVTRYWQPLRPARLVAVIPAGWVMMEWIRGWFLTGFPWLSLGYSQIDSLLAEYAPVAGVYAVSYVTVLAATLIALTLSMRGRIAWLSAGGIAVLFAGAYLLGRASWTAPIGDDLEVSIVQGNISQDLKWVPEQRDVTLETYVKLSRREWDDPEWKADFILWPETAIPAFYEEVADSFLVELQREVEAAGSSLITGIPLLDRSDWQYYNALMTVSDPPAFYYKQHLVPFGEYLPLRSILGTLLQVMPLPVADFSSGKAGQPLLHAAGYPVGSSICYEVVFGEEVAATLPEAAWLVNVSNDGWFGDSLAPHQHLEMARMRALETGRYLMRATNTGISAIIGPRGELQAQIPQFKADVLRGVIQPHGGATPYVRFGNYPVVVFCGAVLVLIWLTRRRA